MPFNLTFDTARGRQSVTPGQGPLQRSIQSQLRSNTAASTNEYLRVSMKEYFAGKSGARTPLTNIQPSSKTGQLRPSQTGCRERLPHLQAVGSGLNSGTGKPGQDSFGASRTPSSPLSKPTSAMAQEYKRHALELKARKKAEETTKIYSRAWSTAKPSASAPPPLALGTTRKKPSLSEVHGMPRKLQTKTAGTAGMYGREALPKEAKCSWQSLVTSKTPLSKRSHFHSENEKDTHADAEAASGDGTILGDEETEQDRAFMALLNMDPADAPNFSSQELEEMYNESTREQPARLATSLDDDNDDDDDVQSCVAEREDIDPYGHHRHTHSVSPTVTEPTASTVSLTSISAVSERCTASVENKPTTGRAGHVPNTGTVSSNRTELSSFEALGDVFSDEWLDEQFRSFPLTPPREPSNRRMHHLNEPPTPITEPPAPDDLNIVRSRSPLWPESPEFQLHTTPHMFSCNETHTTMELSATPDRGYSMPVSPPSDIPLCSVNRVGMHGIDSALHSTAVEEDELLGLSPDFDIVPSSQHQLSDLEIEP